MEKIDKNCNGYSVTYGIGCFSNQPVKVFVKCSEKELIHDLRQFLYGDNICDEDYVSQLYLFREELKLFDEFATLRLKIARYKEKIRLIEEAALKTAKAKKGKELTASEHVNVIMNSSSKQTSKCVDMIFRLIDVEHKLVQISSKKFEAFMPAMARLIADTVHHKDSPFIRRIFGDSIEKPKPVKNDIQSYPVKVKSGANTQRQKDYSNYHYEPDPAVAGWLENRCF